MCSLFFLISRRPPRITRTDPLCTYKTLYRFVLVCGLPLPVGPPLVDGALQVDLADDEVLDLADPPPHLAVAGKAGRPPGRDGELVVHQLVEDLRHQKLHLGLELRR